MLFQNGIGAGNISTGPLSQRLNTIGPQLFLTLIDIHGKQHGLGIAQQGGEEVCLKHLFGPQSLEHAVSLS